MTLKNYFSDEWHEDFQKDGRNGIRGYQDRDIVYEIMKQLGLSHEYIGVMNNDAHYYTKKRSDQALPYKRIRDTADVLGVPPWLIFANTEKNNEMISLYESVEDPLPVYYVNWDEEILVNPKEKETDANNKLLDPDRMFYRFTEILGVIRQALLTKTFQFAARIAILSQGIEVAYLTLRVVKKTKDDLPPNRKKSLTAAWCYVTPLNLSSILKDDYQNAKLRSILTFIVRALNNCLKPNGKEEYVFEDNYSMLISWHSHRTMSSEQVLGELLSTRETDYQTHQLHFVRPHMNKLVLNPVVNRELKQSNNISTNIEAYYEIYFPANPMYEGPMNSHLAYLVEFGHIEDGTVLVCTLADNDKYTEIIDELHDSLKAKVNILGTKIWLEWQYDKKLYKLTDLNQKIIDYYGLDLSAKRGVDFWRFEDGQQSLKKVVEAYKELEGRISLF